ncbi:DUF998 domain-containing protein [Actinocrispum wychmicini]|uniref:Uncharacterized protein DUF998 n=1 Tax=Actinocrispum wychmicini TaxID=1213861 RepID=A0A4R2JI45_9PSEU|nr:DUF998 domain-containing protein [Actinocrispum wychmicini]TCO59571.1 uncharacterized protein DUF998 [Actinocrispum wychmicini]
MTTPVDTASRTWTTRLLRCGVVAGPLFVTAFLLEGATRADYHPLRHPVSTLELGGTIGITQVANFIVGGSLMLCFALGLRRTLRARHRPSTWGPLLIGAAAIGLIGAGIFISDPVSGYPPGTPGASPYSWHGALHDLFSVPTFLGWPVACLVFARRFAGWRQPRWAIYSAATAVLFAIAFVLTSQGFGQTPGLVDIGGLLQRLTITIGWTWLTLLAVHLLKTQPEQR